MRAMVRGVVFFCLLASSACASNTATGLGCAPAPRVEQPPTGRDEVRVLASDPLLKRVGRFDLAAPDAAHFAWPSTEVLIAFEGSALSASFTDAPRADEIREGDWLSVEVDDLPATRVFLKEGRHDYRLAQGLGPGQHLARIGKRTEGEVGTVTLHAFKLPRGGRVLPLPARPARHIEVIGDSISAGYGNEGPDASCHWSAATEDATRTYVTYAARELAAEPSVAAWSGKGLLRNWDGSTTDTMPQLWRRLLPADEHSRVVSSPGPHVVVINLGTNDFLRSVPDAGAFVSAYRALLAAVHQRAPLAPVVLVLSPMVAEDAPQPRARSTLKAYLEKVIELERAQGHRLLLVEQYIDPEEGVGCDFHPSVRSHQRLGKELAEALRELMGW